MSLKKKLVLKALTDAKFRKLLQENPEAALNLDELGGIKAGADVIQGVLDTVNHINEQAEKISDYIFCVVNPNDPPVVLA